MKRLHVHVKVSDLDQSIRFYSTLFGIAPGVTKGDYAKWMLEDPRVNFAISTRGAEAGLDHLGIQVEDDAELAEIAARLKEAGRPVLEQEATTCCYAQSDKAWVADPQGIAWETFRSFGESTVYGDSVDRAAVETGACCTTDVKAAIAPAQAKACCARPAV